MRNREIGVVTVLMFFLILPAFALPSVGDIEAMLNKGDLSGARAGIEQVIRDRPGSAKAYYLYAQILHAQGHNEEARKALGKAELLSPRMDFANPSYLTKLKAELGMPTANSSTPVKAHGSSSWGSLVWPGLGLIAVVLVVLAAETAYERKQRMRQYTGYPDTLPGDRPLERSANLNRDGGAPLSPGYGPPPTARSSGLAGAATGFLAGVAAGTLVDNLLGRENRTEEHPPEAQPTESPALSDADKDSETPRFDTAALGDDWGDAGSASDDASTDFDSGGDSSDW
jgi:hypothetical protein